MALYSVTIVFWKPGRRPYFLFETGVGTVVSSVMVVMRLPISYVISMAV